MSNIIERIGWVLDLFRPVATPTRTYTTHRVANKTGVEHNVRTEQGIRIPGWKIGLGRVVAESYGAKLYVTRNRGVHYRATGTKVAIENTRFMFNYLVGEIERACELTWKTQKVSQIHGKTWKNSFKIGAFVTIAKRLKVVFKKPAPSIQNINQAGFAAGTEMGKLVNLGQETKSTSIQKELA